MTCAKQSILAGCGMTGFPNAIPYFDVMMLKRVRIILHSKSLDNSKGHSLRWKFFIFKEIGVIKHDIVSQVVDRTGVTKTKAEIAVETVFETMKKALAEGDRIELRGFGVFNVRPRKTGIGRNPRTGQEVSIPPGKAVRFKPGKDLQSI